MSISGLFLRSFTAAALPLVAAGLACGQQTPQKAHGLPARSMPSDYTAHLQFDEVTYAASLVPANEVKRIFAFDITKSYVIFEVAVYPKTGTATPLDPEGFVVRVRRTGDVVHNADSVTVASVIQQENLPRPAAKTIDVIASTGVGYESGTDPYTGRRVHGTYTDTQVGVAAGKDTAPPFPSPGGYPQDRQLLAEQLWDKSLPKGKIDRPTAGYLYFPASLLKKTSNGVYEMQYLGPQDQPQLANAPATVELKVPAKSR